MFMSVNAALPLCPCFVLVQCFNERFFNKASPPSSWQAQNSPESVYLLNPFTRKALETVKNETRKPLLTFDVRRNGSCNTNTFWWGVAVLAITEERARGKSRPNCLCDHFCRLVVSVAYTCPCTWCEVVGWGNIYGLVNTPGSSAWQADEELL